MPKEGAVSGQHAKAQEFVSRHTRKIYAFQYQGYLGEVPFFLLEDLVKHITEYDDVDLHQEQVEFHPDRWIDGTEAVGGQVVPVDRRPKLVCKKGDWITRIDRGGRYETQVVSNEDFSRRFMKLA